MDLNQRAEHLAETYADAILRLSYTYLKNTHDAQDVCQSVFVKLLTEPRTFASPEHEKAYVLRMAANACKDILKSPWRRWTGCRPTTAPSSTSIIMRATRRRRSGASWAYPPPPSTPGWPGDGRS